MALILPNASAALREGWSTVEGVRDDVRQRQQADLEHFNRMQRQQQREATARDLQSVELGDASERSPWGNLQVPETTGYAGTTTPPAPPSAAGTAAPAPRSTANLPWPAGRASSAPTGDLPPASNESSFDVNTVRTALRDGLTPAQMAAWRAYVRATRDNPEAVISTGHVNNSRSRVTAEQDRVARMRLQEVGLTLRNGVLTKLTPNYSREALRFDATGSAPQTAQPHAPGPAADAVADRVRQAVPGAVVTSSTRTPEHNREVGGAPNSHHLTGTALDIVLPRGTDPNSVRGALESAVGQQFVEYRDEGDHLHVAWGGGRSPASATQTSYSAPQEYTPSFSAEHVQQVRAASGLGISQRESINRINYLNIMAQNARDYGDIEGFNQAFVALQTEQVNERNFEAQGVIDRFAMSRNPQELSQMLSYYRQYSEGDQAHMTVMPDANNPGYYVVLVDGVPPPGTQPMTLEELVTESRATVNDGFRAQLEEARMTAAAHAAEQATEAYYNERQTAIEGDNQVRVAQINAAGGIARETINTEGQLRVAQMRAQNEGRRLVVQENPAGDGLVAVIMNPDGSARFIELGTEVQESIRRTGGFFGMGTHREEVNVPYAREIPTTEFSAFDYLRGLDSGQN